MYFQPHRLHVYGDKREDDCGRYVEGSGRDMFVSYSCSSFVEGLSSSIKSLSGQKGSRTEFVRGTFRISFTIVMHLMLIAIGY